MENGTQKSVPSPGAKRPAERLGSDADYGVRSTVQADLAAKDAGIAPVAAPPIVIAEDHDRVRTQRRILLRAEGPSDLRRHAHDVEVVARDQLSQHELGVTGRVFHAHREQRVLRDVRKDAVATLFDELEGRVAAEGVTPVACEGVDVDQRLRLLDTPVLIEDGVHQREDCRVGPDPEREGDRRDGREAGRLHERAHSELHIVAESRHDPISSFGPGRRARG